MGMTEQLAATKRRASVSKLGMAQPSLLDGLHDELMPSNPTDAM
jgi:hypothetical protein